MLFFFTFNMAAVISRASNRGGAASSTLYSLSSWTEGNLYAQASIRSAEVKIGPFASDTSPKRIGREGLGKCRTGTRQGTPHYQLYPRPIYISMSPPHHLAIVLYLLPSNKVLIGSDCKVKSLNSLSNKVLFGLKSFHFCSATRFWLVQRSPWNMFFNHSTADA